MDNHFKKVVGVILYTYLSMNTFIYLLIFSKLVSTHTDDIKSSIANTLHLFKVNSFLVMQLKCYKNENCALQVVWVVIKQYLSF